MKTVLMVVMVLAMAGTCFAEIIVTEKAEQPGMGYVIYVVSEKTDITDGAGKVFKDFVVKYDTTENNIISKKQQLDAKTTELQAASAILADILDKIDAIKAAKIK